MPTAESEQNDTLDSADACWRLRGKNNTLRRHTRSRIGVTATWHGQQSTTPTLWEDPCPKGVVVRRFDCKPEIPTVRDSSRLQAEEDVKIASLRCADCGDIHGTVTVDGTNYTADDFGIDSVEEWEHELDKEEDWLRENRDEVTAALASLADEWPRSVAAVRETVL